MGAIGESPEARAIMNEVEPLIITRARGDPGGMDQRNQLRAARRILSLAAVLSATMLLSCSGAADGKTAEDSRDRFVPALPVSTERLEIDAIDKIDVLFVVDNSGSMKEEQQALMAQFPVLARALATGDVNGDGEADFPPPADVQFGVISTDMGLPGITGIDKCDGLGDDGLLAVPWRHPGAACPADLPSFLRFEAGGDLDRVSREFACLAVLGTDGCGFEQPLEAALKALWPQDDDRIVFHGRDAADTDGHGGAENAGFSRDERGSVPSLLVIVTMTDEDDCSAADLSLFTPPEYFAWNEPLAQQPLNLRCFHNPDKLYPVERYANALRLLRPGAPQLVMFAAIAGVPPDLVDRAPEVDFADHEAHETFYRTLLDDPRMQERIDPPTASTPGTGNLIPVCETDDALAYPARRLVQLAARFGENGTVQSICQRDFSDVVCFILVAHRMRNPD
jgi:hypothetical protein